MDVMEDALKYEFGSNDLYVLYAGRFLTSLNVARGKGEFLNRRYVKVSTL